MATELFPHVALHERPSTVPCFTISVAINLVLSDTVELLSLAALERFTNL